MRTVGVEEELLLVDPASGVPMAVAGAMLRQSSRRPPRGGDIAAELQQQQIEVETSPTADMADLESQVRAWRRHADDLARRYGARIAALATSPLPVDPRTTIKPRYQRMVQKLGLTTMEQLTCGCHVHVGVEDDAEGVAVIDRIQPWLPALVALSVNSPFWHGRDTGYASFRTQVWFRLPATGPTASFGSPAAYHDHVRRLVATGVLLDNDMIYFNARLSQHYPTVEVRVPDICARASDTIMIAALVRALVDTAATEAANGCPLQPAPVDLLRLAAWQASRSGLSDELLDPYDHTPRPAMGVVRALLDHVGAALDANGDTDRVLAGVQRVADSGTGADLQRRAAASGDLAGMVRELVQVTLG